jgi:hypothetical protein
MEDPLYYIYCIYLFLEVYIPKCKDVEVPRFWLISYPFLIQGGHILPTTLILNTVNTNALIGVRTNHTIRKCQKMARQNTFEIMLLNDANMIKEH